MFLDKPNYPIRILYLFTTFLTFLLQGSDWKYHISFCRSLIEVIPVAFESLRCLLSPHQVSEFYHLYNQRYKFLNPIGTNCPVMISGHYKEGTTSLLWKRSLAALFFLLPSSASLDVFPFPSLSLFLLLLRGFWSRLRCKDIVFTEEAVSNFN